MRRHTSIALAVLNVFALTGTPARADHHEEEKAPAWQWCEGDWALRYTDTVLGEVSGTVRIGGSKPTTPGSRFQVRMAIRDPRSDRVFGNDGTAEFGPDGQLIVKVANYGPPSRWRQDGGGEAGENAPLTRLPIPRGAPVQAQLEGHIQHAAVIDRPPFGGITIELEPGEGTEDVSPEGVAGTWSYKVKVPGEMARSRAGEHDEEMDTVSGPEEWRRMAPRILAVATLDQPHPSTMQMLAAALDEPGGLVAEAVRDREALAAAGKIRDEHGADALGVIWLTIGGTNLPVQPGRKREVAIADPNVVPLGPTRVNAEYPMALDVQVLLKRTIDGTPKKVTLNGAEGVWTPEIEELAPSIIRFVRRRDEGQFEAMEVVRHGDVFFVEAAYPSLPYSVRQPYRVQADGQPDLSIELEQVPGVPRMYRSGRLVALAPGASAPPAASVGAMRTLGIEGEAPMMVRAPGGKELKVEPVQSANTAEGGNSREVVATIPVTGEPPDSIWQQALAKARECRRKGDSPTEFTNYLLTDLVTEGNLTRTISISVEEHAAAILLRDELVASLDAWVEKQNAPNPVDTTAAPEEVRRQQSMWDAAQSAEAEGLIALASSGGRHPLFNIRVTMEDGFQDGVYLGAALHKWDYQKDMMQRDGSWDEFVGYARAVIGEAKGELIDHAAQSLIKARKPSDCDLRELLRVTGVGVSAVVQRLLPKLVRPPDPSKGESPYPAWIPDREARNHVSSLYVVAQAVAAQEEYSSLDTDMALLVVTGALAGSGYGATVAFDRAVAHGSIRGAAMAARAQQGAAVSMMGLEAVDLFNVAKDSLDWRRAYQDRAFGLGISSVAGDERWLKAREEEMNKRFGLVMTGVLAGAVPVSQAAGGRWVDEALGRVAGAGGLNPARQLQDMVRRQALEEGIDSLPRSGRRILDGMMNDARGRVDAAGHRDLAHPSDRQLLDLADRHGGPAAPEAPDPFGGETLIDIPPSAMSPRERQAFNDRRAEREMQERTTSDFDDSDDSLLPGPVEPAVGVQSRNLTPEEIRRLHEPGRNLTGEEIQLKADLYRQRERLRERARQARLEGRSAEEIHALDQEYLNQVQRIDDARGTQRWEAPRVADNPPPPPIDPDGSTLPDRPGGGTVQLDPSEIVPTRFPDAQRERVGNYFNREHGIPDEAFTNKFKQWEEMGLDPDAVIAGHHFLLNGSRSDLPLPEGRFRASLDRFLSASNPRRPKDQRDAAVDQFLARRGGGGGDPPPPGPPGGGDGSPPGPPSSPGSPPGPDPDGTRIVDIEVPPERLPPIDPADLPPTISGVPGPGINPEHLRDLQRLANETGTPVVAFGSRQSGVRHRTGEPFTPNSDLDVGVIGDADAFRRVLRADVPTRVLDATHGPMWRLDSEQAALDAGALVVRPQPDTLPLPVARSAGDLPPLPPPPPPLPKLASFSPRKPGDSDFNPVGKPLGGSDSPPGSRSDDIELDSNDLRDIDGGGGGSPSGKDPDLPPARPAEIDPKADAGSSRTWFLGPAKTGPGGGTPARYARPDRPVQLEDGRVLSFDQEVINRERTGTGSFADVRRARGPNGERVGLLGKTYGNRRGSKGKKRVQSLEEARQMVRDTVYGDGVLRDYNRGRPPEEQIPVAEVVHAHPDGDPPSLVVREVGGANRPPGVQRELIGKDPAIYQLDAKGQPIKSREGRWRLRPEAGDAILDRTEKLINGRIAWEDGHLGNQSWHVRVKDGKEHWSAGIIDQDRIAHWDDIGQGLEVTAWIDYSREMLRLDPGDFKVMSMAPGTLVDDPRVFNLKMLEHKGYIEFNRQTGKFESGSLDIDRVLERFPDLYDHVTWKKPAAGQPGAWLHPRPVPRSEMKWAA